MNTFRIGIFGCNSACLTTYSLSWALCLGLDLSLSVDHKESNKICRAVSQWQCFVWRNFFCSIALKSQQIQIEWNEGNTQSTSSHRRSTDRRKILVNIIFSYWYSLFESRDFLFHLGRCIFSTCSIIAKNVR